MADDPRESEWVRWTRGFGPGQPLQRRLEVVQGFLRSELEHRPPGPVRVISMCAGDGRDLIGVLAQHPRRADVRARLVDTDPELVRRGSSEAARLGLSGVVFSMADAGRSRSYEGAVPADILLLCGIYGNVSEADIRGMIGHLRELSAPGALAIWTRGRDAPDRTGAIRSWFSENGFQEVAFVPIPDSTMSVGVERLVAPPGAFDPTAQLFTFLPEEERPIRKRKDQGRETETSPVNDPVPSRTSPSPSSSAVPSSTKTSPD